MQPSRGLVLVLLAFYVILIGCQTKTAQPENKAKIRIGFSMDSLQLERWRRDKDLFTQRAEELGAEVLVQSTDGNDAVQVRQAENLLTAMSAS
jgi:D-xylose transport system substrate-binding protein